MQQDWNQVVFNKVKDESTKNKEKRNKSGKKLNIGEKLHKVDNTEIDIVDKVKLSTSRAISKRRTELRLSQKEVASQINEKQEVISQYESGKAIPKQNILQKLEKVLGIYLTGSKIGELKTSRYKSKTK